MYIEVVLLNVEYTLSLQHSITPVGKTSENSIINCNK